MKAGFYTSAGLTSRMIAFLIAIAVLGASELSAQQATFSVVGSVDDEAGNSLPSVNVRVAGTTQGTITNVDGEYSLDIQTAAPSVVLEFSFVGYGTERIIVSASGTYNVTMQEDLLGFEEIVVTGTSGVTEKKKLGNSISTLDARDLEDAFTADVTSALSGKVPGALVTNTSGSPAGEISVKLRGVSTINSGAEPLYIIDGVIVDNSSNELVLVGSGGVQNRLVDLNPNDIERIEVIKGAAAAAVYGSRASNGVVQIFTKRGQSGEPRITFQSNVLFNDVRKTLKVNDAPYAWVDPTDNSNLERRPVDRFDYQDYIFDSSLGTDNYLSIAGGTGKTNYFISGSFYLNDGIIRNSRFTRNTLRANIGQIINDWLVVNVGTNLTRSFSNDVPTGGESFFDGAITTLQFIPHEFDAFPNELGEYPVVGNSFFGNPFEVVDTYDFTQEVNRVTSNVSLSATPLAGLTIDAVAGYDTYSQLSRGFKPISGVAVPNGFARRGDLDRKLANTDLNIQYQRAVTDDLVSTTGGGATYQYDRTETILNEANNLGPIVETVEGGTLIANADFISERSLWGAYLQETLAFKERLFVTVAGRIDGSSVFGEDEREQFYPKVSGAYILSEQGFWEESLGSVFNLFKVRASWGKSGNLTGIGPYERFTNYNPVSFGGQTGLIPSTALGNPDIKPETQTEFEIGADMALFRNRLGLEVTYYDQKIEDLLLSRVLSPSTGADTRIENVGELTNKGLEVLLRGVVLQTRDMGLRVTANFSRNRNKVTDLVGDRFAIGQFTAQWAIEGEPLGVYYWRAYARTDDGSLLLTPGGLPQAERGSQALQDETGDGAQRDASGQPTGSLLRVIVGDPNPSWQGALITDFDYKDFSFRMQWETVQDFGVMNWNRRNFDRHNYRGGFDYGRELKDNPDRPKGWANALGSGLILEEYVEDGSFIKLREISFAYRLKPKSDWVRGIEFKLAGRNLVSIDDYQGYDPEVTISGRDTGVRGFDFGTVPLPRTIIGGVTLNF